MNAFVSYNRIYVFAKLNMRHILDILVEIDLEVVDLEVFVLYAKEREQQNI